VRFGVAETPLRKRWPSNAASAGGFLCDLLFFVSQLISAAFARVSGGVLMASGRCFGKDF
jgi:hypothetical protein